MTPLFEIIFKQDWRCFKKDQKFEFRKGINLLVGDQGTGKSSLLKLIFESKKHQDIIKINCKEKFKTAFLDFEKQNPRTEKRIDTIFQIASIFSSHGETVNSILHSIKKLEEDIVLMDEPDMALSIRSILKLVKLFKELETNKTIITSAHNPYLIEPFDVLSLEHRKWMSGKEFIEISKKGETNDTSYC